MDVLFLLIPLSVLLAFAVLGLLAWAVWAGQFEDMEGEGQRIFDATDINTTTDIKGAVARGGDAST
jgi:cbb3-type cytochrome oxidase maturation protein